LGYRFDIVLRDRLATPFEVLSCRSPRPSQTVGPFFAIMLPLAGAELVPRDHPDAIVVEGQILTGRATRCDAMIEVWQADVEGVSHPMTPGWDRSG
jgi:protocatechuate 3,4-dioxygenase beta subunit